MEAVLDGGDTHSPQMQGSHTCVPPTTPPQLEWGQQGSPSIKAFVPRRRQTACPKDLLVRG